MTTPAERPVVLTCSQPSAQLHLGNYLGAVKHWATLIDEHDCFFGVVDQHAITVDYTPADLRKNTLDLIAQYIACGLDPAKCSLFVQSHVHGHNELGWVLGCICPLGQLQRMTQFKDKSARQNEHVGAGLLFYPVLMAADILLYNADLVPVGEDQKQHLELTRNLAERFNHVYSPTFNVPEPFIPPVGARIMSLQDPGRKMSKSEPSGCLFLFDEPNTVRKKIMSAVTDTGKEITASPDKPGITNLLNILSAVSGKPVADLEAEFAHLAGYAAFKEAVADAVNTMLDPLRSRYAEVSGDKKQVETVLRDGAAAAQKRAYKMLAKVYRKVGFVERPR